MIVVLFLLFVLGILVDREDLSELKQWKLYGLKVIRAQTSDLHELQNKAQIL
jgi:hypothetical protein